MRTVRMVIVAALLSVAAMPSAHAATAYAYWSYWQADGSTWKYANVGPALSPAVDGAVDAWRFTVSSESRASKPTTLPDFAAVCGGTAKATGKARVAIYIEYGVGGPATRSACAVVDDGLTRMSALGSVSALRLNNGFICAIDAFPATGCGDAVPDTSATAAADSKTTTANGGSSPLPTILSVILGALAVALALRSARIQRGEP